MQRLGLLIGKLEKASSEDEGRGIMMDLREHLYKMEYFEFVNEELIHTSKALSPKQGLPRLFSHPRPAHIGSFFIPCDISSDAEALHRRWAEGQYDWSLLRGILLRKTVGKPKRGVGLHRALASDYEWAVPSDYEGARSLYNGQWWPYRICHVRDGAHGHIEAGIWGANRACVAVVVADSRYCDIDQGEILYYCSTEGKLVKRADNELSDRSNDKTPEVTREDANTDAEVDSDVYEISEGAKLLLQSLRRGTKIRVIRSSKLPAGNKYRPVQGLRYDGLYTIESHTVLDAQKHVYRFKLVRLGGQDPIRCEAEIARPSMEERRRFDEIRELQGLAE
jgi:hypothetical protein